jgi:hypothetical protein
MIRYTPTQTISVDAAASDGAASRTISGVAVEFNVVATVNDGQQVSLNLVRYLLMAETRNYICNMIP